MLLPRPYSDQPGSYRKNKYANLCRFVEGNSIAELAGTASCSAECPADDPQCLDKLQQQPTQHWWQLSFDDDSEPNMQLLCADF